MALVETDLLDQVTDKVDVAIRRLQAFCPPEGYYVAFSGGKDSQCIYHLCEMADVPFDAHYSITSVDPPELIQFIKQQYPDVSRDLPHDADGKPISMWNLIPRKLMPPTRNVRYCCSVLKESNGRGRVTVTGVRWSESINRSDNQGLVTIMNKSAQIKKTVGDLGANHTVTRNGGLILNDDNHEARRMVEHCYRTSKTIVNPIIDWLEADVWEFLNAVACVPHCCLYDEGFSRIGCIGCPMAGAKQQKAEFLRWPKYRVLYLRAFERMIAVREARAINEKPTYYTSAEAVMDWWLQKTPMRQLTGQTSIWEDADDGDI